jgi:hypothetical protein
MSHVGFGSLVRLRNLETVRALAAKEDGGGASWRRRISFLNDHFGMTRTGMEPVPSVALTVRAGRFPEAFSSRVRRASRA